MQIVEHQHEGPGPRKALEQLTHRAMSAVALVLERSSGTGIEPRQRGKDVRQLGPNVLVECLEAKRLEALNVLLERIDEQPERQISLELRCRSVEHELPARVGATRELREESGLADPGLTHQHERSGSPAPQPDKRVIECSACLGAPNELLANRSHFPRSRRE